MNSGGDGEGPSGSGEPRGRGSAVITAGPRPEESILVKVELRQTMRVGDGGGEKRGKRGGGRRAPVRRARPVPRGVVSRGWSGPARPGEPGGGGGGRWFPADPCGGGRGELHDLLLLLNLSPCREAGLPGVGVGPGGGGRVDRVPWALPLPSPRREPFFFVCLFPFLF